MKNFQTFKNPYVLVEDSAGKFQPIYKEYLKEPPRINFSSPALCCPFVAIKRTGKTTKKNIPKPGYCEVCLLKYENYASHVISKNHLTFATDPKNYWQIDKFIQEMGVQEFIQVPSSPSSRLASLYARGEIDSAESLIRISIESSGSENALETFDVIMNDFNLENCNK